MTEEREDRTGYVPSPTGWVRRQVERIEAAGDTRAVDINGLAVVLMTMRGVRSGAIRKVPVMRVEHDGSYAAIGSKGGAPQHPAWVHNLRADPDITLLDGTSQRPMRAREVSGDERSQWWERAVAAFPDYADYEVRATAAERIIPVFVLEPVDRG